VHAETASRGALERLAFARIPARAERIVEFILNSRKTGRCLFEKLGIKHSKNSALLKALKKKLRKKG